MRTNQAVRSTPNLVDKPERLGPALAQVVREDDGGRDLILGQAWLAATNRLVTCGHVIESFAQNPAGLFVYFPATGKRYPVLQVRMHPSFVRQPDGLVKFDVAVLSVQLAPPDSLAVPLPFSYEHTLQTNQTLWTIRFPVHLGQLSSAPQPLSQDGRFLGLLRKHDSFHLLHDLPLAPGDSGAPICDGRRVVAIHCGDTATLPGLNLPTTSIRLALWIDALRELNLLETRKSYINRTSRLMSAAIAFVVMFAISFAAGTFFFQKPQAAPTAIAQPAMMPITIKLNKAPDAYELDEAVEMTLISNTPVFPYIFLTNKAGHVIELFPPGGKPFKLVGSRVIEQSQTINGMPPQQLSAPGQPVNLYLLGVKADDADAALWASDLLKPGEINRASGFLSISESTLLSRIRAFEKQHPDLLAMTKIEMPGAKPRK